MKFSIIVPVYNAEKYIVRCIESIKKQTYKNWELFIIDDGSTDNSWFLIQKLSQGWNNIEIIHQENKGPGVSRNIGITKATGDYIIFIDADDYIDSEYFSLLIKHTKNNDLIFIDVIRVSETGKKLQDEKISVYKTWSKDKIIRAMITGKIPWGGVRKVVKRDIILKYNIFYSDLKIGEEALFSFKALFFSQSYDFINEKPVYMYVQRKNSQSNFPIIDPWGRTFQFIKEYIKLIGLYEKYADTLNAFKVVSTIVSIDRITLIKDKDVQRRLIKDQIMKFEKDYDKKYGLDTSSLNMKAKIFIPFLKIRIFYPIIVASKLRRKIKGKK